jgi:hypothetical protein
MISFMAYLGPWIRKKININPKFEEKANVFQKKTHVGKKNQA